MIGRAHVSGYVRSDSVLPKLTALILAIGLLAVPLAGSSKSAAKSACDPDTRVDYGKKSDLPPEVAAMIGEMAEAGAPFQETDALTTNRKPLPFRRFVVARQVGCRLQVLYQQGGRALGQEAVDFYHVGDRWTARRP